MSFTLADYFLRVPGDLELDLKEGRLQVHRTFLQVASTVFSDAFSTEVEGPSTSMKMLYPIHPRPEITFARVADVLPVLHMYNFGSLIQECLVFLNKHFPASLSPDPKSPCYVTTWLALADDLQLEGLREMCMHKVRELALNRQVESLLLAPAQVDCPCGAMVELPGVSTSANCQACNLLVQRLGTRWFQGDKPRLADGIKRLSQPTQEELFVSVVIACGGSFGNSKRPVA